MGTEQTQTNPDESRASRTSATNGTEPVEQALSRIERRLDRLESSISRLTLVLDQAPMMMASFTDVADAHIRDAAAEGVDVDARARRAVRVVGKFTDPAMLDTLELLADRADKLEQTIALLDQLPGQVAMFADMADSYLSAAAESGVDVDARLRQLARVAGKATDPTVLGALEKLVEHGDDFQKAVELLDDLPASFATMVDVADAAIARAAENGIDVVELGRTLASGSSQLARFVQSREFRTLLDSGVLDPTAIETVGQVGEALASTKSAGRTDDVGFFGLMGAMRDDHIQRALGFAVEFGRRFGQALDNGKKQLPE
ncbi:MAG: DUF1641 domain-containing protein [Myxococcota bacterium]